MKIDQQTNRHVEEAIKDGRLKGLKMSLNFALKFEDIMMQTPAQFYSGMPRFLQNEEPLVFNEDFVHRNDIGEAICRWCRG